MSSSLKKFLVFYSFLALVSPVFGSHSKLTEEGERSIHQHFALEINKIIEEEEGLRQRFSPGIHRLKELFESAVAHEQDMLNYCIKMDEAWFSEAKGTKKSYRIAEVRSASEANIQSIKNILEQLRMIEEDPESIYILFYNSLKGRLDYLQSRFRAFANKTALYYPSTLPEDMAKQSQGNRFIAQLSIDRFARLNLALRELYYMIGNEDLLSPETLSLLECSPTLRKFLKDPSERLLPDNCYKTDVNAYEKKILWDSQGDKRKKSCYGKTNCSLG